MDLKKKKWSKNPWKFRFAVSELVVESSEQNRYLHFKQVKSTLDLRNPIFPFLNWELFDLRKILRTGHPKKMSYVGESALSDQKTKQNKIALSVQSRRLNQGN